MAAIVLLATLSAYAATTPLLLRSESLGTDIYDATTTHTIETNYGNATYPWAALPFTGTTTYDFFSPPLTAAVALANTDTVFGSVNMTNESGSSFVVTGEYQFYDYNPATGSQTLIVGTGVGTNATVNTATLANLYTPTVTLPAGYTVPVGDLLHIAVTVTLVSGTPSTASFVYNGISGGHVGTGAQLPSNRSVTWSFGALVGPLDHFVVSTPGTETAGKAFPITTITAQDSGNRTKTSYTGTVDLTETGSGAGGSVSPAQSSAFAGGLLSGQSVTLSKSGSAVTITATDHGGTSTGVSGTFLVNPGAATQLVMTGSGTQTAGASQNLTITAEDAYGNTDTTYTGSKSLTFSGASNSANPVTVPTVKNSSGTAIAFGAVTAVTFNSGVATVSGGNNGVMTLYAAQTATISVSDGTITSSGSGGLSVAVSAASMNKFVLSLTSPQVNGTAFTGANTLTAEDAYGNTVGFNASTNNVTIAANSPLTGTISGLSGGNKLTSATDFSSGVASLTTLAMTYTGNANSGTFTATATTGGYTGASGTVTVNPGVLSQFVMNPTTIASATAGASVSGSFTSITAKDASGNVCSSGPNAFTGTVTFGGTAGATGTSAAFSAGVLSTFPALTPTVAGSGKTVTATSGSVVGTTTITTVNAGAATQMIVTLPGQTFTSGSGNSGTVTAQTAGTAFTIVKLTAVDNYNNTATSYSGSKTIAYSGPANSPSGSAPTYTKTVSFTSGQSTTTLTTTLKDAQTTTITATQGTLAGVASSSLTVNPAAANKLVMKTEPSNSVTAGAAFGTQPAVYVEDTYGNVLTGDNSSTVTAAVHTGTGPLTGTTTATAASGVATFSGLAAPTTAQSGLKLQFTDAGDGLSALNDATSITVNAGTAITMIVTLPGQTFTSGSGNSGTVTAQTAGTSFTIVKLTAVDNYNNTATTYSGAKTITYSGPANSPSGSAPTYTTAVSFTAGQSTTTLTTTLKDAQTTTITATDGTLAGAASSSLTVNPAVASKLVFTTTTVTVTAGVASGTITVQRQDQYNNPNTADAARTVTLSSTSTGTVTFTPASPLTIALGSSSASFTYTDTKAGTPTVTAASTSPTTITSATQVETVNPTTASKLVFTTTAVTVTAGVASGTITVQRQDQYNNPNTADAAQTVTLSSTSSGTVTFTPASPLTIALGSSSANFTYTDTQAGTPTITAASTSPTTITSATQVETVNPAAASKLVMKTEPSNSVTAGAAFGTQPAVYVEDTYGNVLTGDNSSTVTAAVQTGTGPLTGTTTATAASGVATFSGLAAPTKAQSGLKLQFTDAGDGLSALNDATSITVNAGTAATMIVTLPGQTFTSGSGNSGTVTAQTAGTSFTIVELTAVDNYNNIVPSYSGAKTITYSGPANSPSGSAPTYTTAVSFTSGQSTTTLTTTLKDAQTTTITATDGTLPGTASSSLTVNPAAASKLVFTTTAVTVTAGVASGTITVQRQDQYNNPNTADAARTVTLSSTSSGTVTFTPASPLTIALGSSSANFTYKDTQAGTPTITAASTSPTTITSATQVETVNPAAASKLVFTTTAVTVTAGVASGTITVQRQDQYNNPNTADAARTVTLSSTSTGTVTFTPASPLTIALGSSSASFTYTDTKAGTPTITAASTLPTTITSATQVETVNPAAASKLVFTTTAVTVTAGVASGTITVQRQDQYNNPNTADAARTVTLSSTSTGTVTFTPASPLTIALGSSSANFTYKDTQAGTPTVTAASTSPTTITSATQVETVNPAAASKLVFTTTAVTVTAGVASGTITVQRQDQYNNPNTADAARTVTLSSTSTGTATFTPASPLTIALGSSSASFTYTDTKAGTPTITAASTSPTTITSATQVETVNPTTASKLVFTTTAVTVTAGVASGTITVQRQDQYNNPNTADAARTVTLSSTSSGTVTFTPASPLTIALGSSSANFTYTDTQAGTPTITAASTSPTTITSATQVETVNPAVASKLVFTTTPVTVTAGVASGTITVQRQDQYNNPNTADAARTVTLSSTSIGTVTFTPASPLTIVLGSSSVSFTYTDTKAGTPTVTAASTSPTAITSATQVETVNPGTANKLAFTTQPPANTTAGSNMAGFVVQVEDSYGNAVADNGVVVTLTPSSGSIYSGATATTAASGAATFSSTVIWTAETGIDFAASATSPSLSGTSGAFNITPECSAGETTKGYSVNYVSGTAYIGFTNQYGLGSVVGLRLTNCTMTAQPYGAGGVPLGSPLSLPDNNIGGSYVVLPAGTTNVLCTATKNNGSLAANANAMVKNLCGTFALKLDPVSARLEIAGGGRTQLIFTNVPAAERFISVQNGMPGLTKLTLLVNGQSFLLSPLGAGSSKSLDVGAAMNPGNANIVVLLGEGAEGATATIAIADSPTGDATMVAESIALQIETSAQGLQLSWPIAGAGYSLQSRSSLAPGDAWVHWPVAAESVNGRWVMPLPPGDPARFFRLYYQP